MNIYQATKSHLKNQTCGTCGEQSEGVICEVETNIMGPSCEDCASRYPDCCFMSEQELVNIIQTLEQLGWLDDDAYNNVATLCEGA
jgi:hypothetical protein